MESMPDWVKGFPGAVTVTDSGHRVVYMNDAAAETFAERGGRDLVGTDLMSHHNPRSREIIEKLLATGGTNTYTIEKSGVKKLIYQTVWRDSGGKPAGLVELSLVIPGEMPHRTRS